jgi:HAD superfamily hydrolase (TIGR01509 family)
LAAARRKALGERFREAVLGAMLKCPEVAGARDLLARCRGKVPLYVVSGTPEDELRDIVRHRGLDAFFTEVHGTPRGKPEIVGDILARHAYAPEQCVFVGDAPTDFAAAQECGLRFVGVVPHGGVNPFPPGTIAVPDLTGFERALRSAGFTA